MIQGPGDITNINHKNQVFHLLHSMKFSNIKSVFCRLGFNLQTLLLLMRSSVNEKGGSGMCIDKTILEYSIIVVKLTLCNCNSAR